MLQIDKIQTSLLHLVGWEQSIDPQKAFDESLTRSESGLYFQNAHPLLTIDNIIACAPEIYGRQYPEWQAGTIYTKGFIVKKSNQYYYALQNSQGIDPTLDTSADYWKQIALIDDYITRLTKAGIAQMVQTFLQIKSLKEETKNILERRTFFDGAGRLSAILPNSHKIVGFEIVPVRSMGVTTKIERVGLQFTGGTGTVKLYLFHSSQVDPIQTFEVEYTKTNGGFQWFDLTNCYLPYISDENNSGGAWYLCYNQDELPEGMTAINVSKDWSREPCGTCNIGNLEAWRLLTKYLQISPFRKQAPTTFSEFPEMWDIAENAYTNTTNYGLNCEISVGCDLTDFIIRERGIFATVLQRQVAVNILRSMAMNPDVRVNRNQSNVSRMDILYEIDGKTDGQKSGLGYELKKAYEALSLDTRGIDRICLLCNNHGVKYTTC
jgi:hypothetical protein